MLVLVAHGVCHPVESRERAQDALSYGGVLAHGLPLVLGELPRLMQDRVGGADLPDVVQQSGGADEFELVSLQAESPGDREREPVHGVGMSARVAVARLERRGERAHDRPVGLSGPALVGLELAQHGDERLLARRQSARGVERLAAQPIEPAARGCRGHPLSIGSFARAASAARGKRTNADGRWAQRCRLWSLSASTATRGTHRSAA